jgi:hypothetical protein
MAAATLRRGDGSMVHMPRVVLVAPTSITYSDVLGATHRAPWSPVYDQLEYPSAAAVIRALESALARATGRSVEVVRLTHGYDADTV